MNSSFKKLLHLIPCFALAMIIQKGNSQSMTLSYNIVSQTSTTMSFEVYIANNTGGAMRLSAFTNAYNYSSGLPSSPLPGVTWVEGSDFVNLNNPTGSSNTSRVRTTQTPIGNSGSSISVPASATLLGTMTITTTGTITYPTTLTPASTPLSGSSTMQAVVYLGTNTNPTTLTLASGTISAPVLTFLVLPVELTEFNAIPKNSSNHIEWSTASELNSQYHIVERSADGINNWTEVGRKLAAGTTQVKQRYSLEDTRPLTISYYRLKMLDFDGKFEYSKIVSVERAVDGFALTNVFPVPTDQKVTLQVSMTNAANLTVTVNDLSGRIVSITEMKADAGVNNLDLDVSGLAAGAYFVKIDNGGKVLTEQIVKQ